MFFILSKILFFLIAPLSWIFILLVWILLSKSKTRKKRLLMAVMVVLFVFTNSFIYRKAVLAWQPEPVTLTRGKVYEAGILLGGMISFDVDHKGFFGDVSDRFIEAEKLYHQGFIKKVVMTGGSGDLLHQEDKEADFIKGELIASGVNTNDIIIENNSRNTFENAVFTKRVLDSLQIKGPYVLITSAIHIPRASKVFTKAGLTIVPYPADFHVIHSRLSWTDFIVPDPSLLHDWNYFIKEMVGTAVYSLTGKA